MGLLNCSKEREEAIKELAILKLKKLYSDLSEEEYVRSFRRININLSEYDRALAKIAFEIAGMKIEAARERQEVKLLFNEKLKLYNKEECIPRVADILLLGAENVEVIEIVPLMENQIFVNKEIDMKLLGLAAIDKYLTYISCDYIRISVIQPNLMTSFYFETAVADLIHECEYDLMYL